MRILIYKMMHELKGLGVIDAMNYSSFDRFTKSAFVNAFYEIRLDGNFESYLRLFGR